MNRTSINYLSDDGEERDLHYIRSQESGHDDDKRRRTSSTSSTAIIYDVYDEWDEFIVRGAPESDFSPPSPPPRPPGIRPPPTPPSTPLLLFLPGPRSTPSPTSPRTSTPPVGLGFSPSPGGEQLLIEASIVRGGGGYGTGADKPPTGPAGHVVQETEDIVFFPTLRKWRINHLALQASGVSPGQAPTARCPICRIRRLDIAELQPEPQPQPQPAGGPSRGEEESEYADELELERAVVLFCGHMFGRECLTAWLKCNDGTGQEYVCPACREDVCYASNGRADGCDHYVSGVYVDRCGGILRVPATRDEGGRVPDRCDRCRALEWTSRAARARVRGGGETVSDCSVGWGNRDVADGI